MFVRDGNVTTSAGVTAGIDLALALVEEDHGADLAGRVAAAQPCSSPGRLRNGLGAYQVDCGQAFFGAKGPLLLKACPAKRSPMRRWPAASGSSWSGSGSSSKSGSP
ncbi:hypothetical protein [Saccharopolyspora spinosa]|uniref:hypothetical protein n=1 Tax=Saccharopolyspora spinosa TaxID=60894 RepID=UPI00023792C1